MHRMTKLAAMAAFAIAGTTGLAFAAQDTTPPPPAPGAAAPAGAPMMHGKGPGGHGPADHDGRGGWGGRRGFGGQHDGVVGDLHALERLYLLQGKPRELIPLYNEVLAKSTNPRTRDYVFRALARAQAAPTNVDSAIATMRKSLDENLANEKKHEAMRDEWRAKRAGDTNAK
jgi:hypothetical protein